MPPQAQGTKEYFRSYRERNRERLRAYQAAYYAKNKEQIKARSRDTWHRADKKAYMQKRKVREEGWEEERKDLKTKAVRYAAWLKILARRGITEEQYEQMRQAQGYACAICRLVPEEVLFIDHDHATGVVRGLLCRGCNSGIGMLKDKAEFLSAAITYLTK